MMLQIESDGTPSNFETLENHSQAITSPKVPKDIMKLQTHKVNIVSCIFQTSPFKVPSVHINSSSFYNFLLTVLKYIHVIPTPLFPVAVSSFPDLHEKPVSLPLVSITRWQGINKGMEVTFKKT